jgi:hypothetical protein
VGFEIVNRVEVYADAPQSSNAMKFGTLGITFRARRPTSDAEWQEALARLTCEV